MAKVHDNTMLINNNIRNHWGGVFSVLTGYTSAFEFYNNTVNSGISCEHRIDEEHIITPNTLNIYIHHNYFYIDSEGFKGVQAIELYVDNAEISHNYFENVNGITSWQGNDTLKNVLIHHNIFNGPGFKSGIKLTMGGNSSTKGFSVYENFQIYNNVFDNYDIAIENYYGKTKDFEIKNNVFLNLNDQVWYHHNHQSPENIIFDHNLAYNHTSLQNDNSADFNNTLENVDPGLKLSGNIPGEWYQASGSESNVVDAGLLIDPYTQGFGGSAPDLGAFEFNGSVPERLIAPILSKQPGEYYDHLEMVISDSNDVASIYYTLDGSIPDSENGVIYTSPFIIDKSGTLNAVCYQENMLPSYVVSSDFYIYEQKVATPVFTVKPGEYNSPVAVKIESDTQDAKIIYTTDGTMPSSSNGNVYKAPVYLDESENMYVKAFKDGMFSSDLVSAKYVIEYDGFGEGEFINNDHDSIRYSEHFWNHLSDQENDYLQDIHTCFSQGSFFEYEFTGTGILYLAPRKKDLAEEIEIYIDDELFTVLGLYQQDEVHQDTVFAYSRLPHGKHTIKVVKSSLTGSIALDALVLFDKPTSGKNLQHSQTINVYPNPVKDYLYVQFSSQQAGAAYLEIYSIGGERLLQNRYLVDQHENTIPLDITQLSSGMYILGIKVNDKQSFRKIILK